MKAQSKLSEVLRNPSLPWRLLKWHVLRAFRKSVVAATRQGIFRLSLEANDPISRHLYTRGQFEQELMTEVMTFLKESNRIPGNGKGVLLDVGANNGVTSIALLRAGHFERSVALEPEPGNFALLEENAMLNQLADRIVCLAWAASDEAREVEFELSRDNWGDHRVRPNSGAPSAPELQQESTRAVIRVQADAIDQLLKGIPGIRAEDVSAVWIDVQGHEGFAFRGARELLSRDIPVVSELWPYGIRRSGMAPSEFLSLAGGLWSAYWVRREGKFVRHPIGTLNAFFEELGYTGNFDNVIFTK